MVGGLLGVPAPGIRNLLIRRLRCSSLGGEELAVLRSELLDLPFMLRRHFRIALFGVGGRRGDGALVLRELPLIFGAGSSSSRFAASCSLNAASALSNAFAICATSGSGFA
jgi:hypothetical protein